MNDLEKFLKDSNIIESKIHYTFKDKRLLTLAFTHRSYLNENKDLTQQHNERLEFLGDSVLGLLIVEYLYTTLPQLPEGQLSCLLSRLVEASSCARYIKDLDLEKHILLGKGERRSLERSRQSILADLFEAIIGAIYLDKGLDAARDFLFQNFHDKINAILKKPDNNWKADLQDYVQKQHKETPVYQVCKEEGPDHSKTFEVEVIFQNKVAGIGSGSSKKEAQQAAAADAFKNLEMDKNNG